MTEELLQSPADVLIIGESPTLLCLSYVLTQNDLKVALFPYADKSAKETTSRTIIVSDTIYHYTPHIHLKNLIELASYIAECHTNGHTFSYIFFNSKFASFLNQTRQFLSQVVAPDTMVFFDATAGHLDYDSTISYFPQTVVLTMFSQIDCRLVDLHSNTYISVDDTFKVVVGSIQKTCNYDTVSCLNLNFPLGARLGKIKRMFEDTFAQGKFQILPADAHKIFKRILWDNFVSRICFRSISIAYDEPSIKGLLEDKLTQPVIIGVFHELVNISKGLHIKNADVNKPAITKYYNGLVDSEIEAEQMRIKIIGSRNYLPKFIESNHMFFSFSQGHEVEIAKSFSYILDWAQQFSVEIPFLKSVSGFIAKSLAIRDERDHFGNTRDSSLFKARNFCNDFIKLFPVNGIPAERNMMNFPPFYPKPSRIPPNNFQHLCMVLTNVVEVKDDESEEDVIDPELKNLIQGREMLTYGEEPTFYDASDSRTPQEGPSAPQVNNTAVTHTPSPIIQSSTPSSATLPSTWTHFKDDKGNLYLRQADGSITPLTPVTVTPGTNFASPRPVNRIRSPTRPKPFFHMPVPITRRTSHEKLRESQAMLLDKIQFDEALSQNAASRYGDLDSLNKLWNSDTSSSRSSGRSKNSK